MEVKWREDGCAVSRRQMEEFSTEEEVIKGQLKAQKDVINVCVSVPASVCVTVCACACVCSNKTGEW